MDKEKMNARELTEKELEQVSGGNMSNFNWTLFKKLYMERLNPPEKYSKLYSGLLSNNWAKAECYLIPWIAKGDNDIILIVKEVQDNQ